MSDSESSNIQSVKQSKTPLYISLLIFAGLILSYFLIPGVKQFFHEAWEVLTSDDQQRRRGWGDQFGFWGPAVIVAAMVVQMFLLVIPTPLLMVVSTLAYGSLWGTITILVAVFVASSVGYGIGAYLGAPVVTKLLGNKAEKKVESFIQDYGFWTVVVTRLSPFLSNDAVSFVGGLLRMGYWRFITATLIGILPLTLLIAYLGQNIDRLERGLVWGSVVSILLFALYVWWDKRRGKGNEVL